jgi:hypothetical protein
VPLPVPAFPDVTISHGAALTAVHWQYEGDATVNVPLKGDGLSAMPGGVSATVHAG